MTAGRSIEYKVQLTRKQEHFAFAKSLDRVAIPLIYELGVREAYRFAIEQATRPETELRMSIDQPNR